MPINSIINNTVKPSSKSDVLPGAWLVVVLLFFVGALNYLDRTTITTMHESITTSLHITDAQFGLLTSVFLWVYGILSPFAGFLADRYKRSSVIVGSLVVWSAVTVFTGFATTFGQLLATRALMGISEAAFIPAALALVMDYHRGSTRSLAAGITMAGVMVGSSLGFVGGMIAEHHNWHLAFHIFGVIGIIYSIIVFFTLHDVPQSKKRESTENKEDGANFFKASSKLFRNKSYILLIVLWGLLGAVGWLVIGWLPTYYHVQFNLSQTKAGLYATAFIYPASIVGQVLGGHLSDRWSKTNPRGRILLSAIALCVAGVAVFIAGGTSILILVIIMFVAYAMLRICTDTNLMPILRMVADSRYSATGYGILNFFATIVGGIGLYAAGVLRDTHINFSIMFQVAGILLFVSALLLYMVKINPRIKNNSDEA